MTQEFLLGVLLMILETSCTFQPSASSRGLASICPEQRHGKEIFPGIIFITGYNLIPFQTQFCEPELADPYVTLLKDSAIISGTAPYYLNFRSIEDMRQGGPYQLLWNDFYYSDGTAMEGNRSFAHSWDMKPVLWDSTDKAQPPLLVWYGGHMRPQAGEKISHWPEDNFSRDVFAFAEKNPGQWFSGETSIFAARKEWPRTRGNFLGHRYGHQIIKNSDAHIASVFFEEVTSVRADGSPAVTKIFMDEMLTPFQARGAPIELISPMNPATGKAYPSALREDGAALVEGPLYFRFQFENELWEAIGFSAGSFYGNYPALFASRKVSEGLNGKPFQLDLEDNGSDFHNAGSDLGQRLNLMGGPGRPAVIVGPDGLAVPDTQGSLQLLFHAYRKDILPDNGYGKLPMKYRWDQMYRAMMLATLRIEKKISGTLRFQISALSAF